MTALMKRVLPKQVERSLLVTGFGYDHDAAWETNLDLFKHFTDTSRVHELHMSIASMSIFISGVIMSW